MTLDSIPRLKKPDEALITRIETLEAKNKGMVAAIDPDSGDYFLGNDTMTAVKKGRQQRPEAVFYCIRIGYPGVYEHRGSLVKA